jgi:hypothetical protein
VNGTNCNNSNTSIACKLLCVERIQHESLRQASSRTD